MTNHARDDATNRLSESGRSRDSFFRKMSRASAGVPFRGVGMKRFTETTKWDDPWFMDLPVKYKLFWLYICDRCDNAGAWEPNMRLATTQIGESLELIEILRVFAGRITQLEGGKLFITRFIPFQYGNLSPNCRAHIPILNSIEKLRVSKGYPKGIHTLMEKEKDKETEKEGGVRGGFKKPSLNELVEILGTVDKANEFWDYYESNGWKVGRNAMKDWKATARRWNRGGNDQHSEPRMSPHHRQNKINFLNEKKQKINRQIKDPNNPPSWAERELIQINEQLKTL